MKNILKKGILLFSIFVICFSSMGYSNVFAQESPNSPEKVLSLESESDLRRFSNDIKNLSESDLQKVIEYAQIKANSRSITNTLSLKAAWLAAAQVARLKGYPLSASLVEHSVWSNNYSEKNGKFAKAIRTTKAYRRMIKNGRGSDAFKKNEHRDLFYAIHKFSYTSAGSSQGMRIRVRDKFDFALDASYDNLFTSIVNNWAFLNQNMRVLHPIQVDIRIDV